MTIKAKITAVIATVAIFGAVGGVLYYLAANKAKENKIENLTLAQQLRDCLPKSDTASKEKCNRLIKTIMTFNQCVDAEFSVTKHYPDQCQTPDGRIFVDNNPPDQNKIAKAEKAIRNFMASPNLEFRYISTAKNPSNFTVGKIISKTENSTTMDTPSEWERPIYIFQQKEYIDDLCEIYEYEVSIKTYQIIEIHVRYPEEINPMTTEQRKAKCGSYGSMEVPLKTKNEIEQIAFGYLQRDPSHTKLLLRSDIKPEYTPSKKGVANPAHNVWQWEDKNYKLPEGFVGDPYQYPVIRIVVSSGGKLVNYLNTSELYNE